MKHLEYARLTAEAVMGIVGASAEKSTEIADRNADDVVACYIRGESPEHAARVCLTKEMNR